MADEQNTPATGAESDAQNEGAQQEQQANRTDADIEAVAAQADKPDAVRTALQAERENARKARERAEELELKVREFEDRDKSEQEKLEERAGTAEQRAAKAEAKLLRFEVATEKKLPLELADRLQGDTKKDLEADAERLLELVKPNGRSNGDADAGRGDAPTGGDLNDLIRARVKR